MNDETKDMAAKHVDWWLSSVRQLLIDNFVHGYKHGRAEAFREVNEMERQDEAEYAEQRARRKRRVKP